MIITLLRVIAILCTIMGLLFGYDAFIEPDKTEHLTVTKTEVYTSKDRKRQTSYNVTAMGSNRYIKGFSKSSFKYFKVGQKIEVSISRFTDEWMTIKIIDNLDSPVVVPDSRPNQFKAFSFVLLILGMLGIFGNANILTKKYIQFSLLVGGLFSSVILLKIIAVELGYFSHV